METEIYNFLKQQALEGRWRPSFCYSTSPLVDIPLGIQYTFTSVTGLSKEINNRETECIHTYYLE